MGCNQLFAESAGFTLPEEIVGKSDLDLPWAETEADGYRRDDQEVMSSGMPKLDIEETQSMADGRLAYVRTNKIPLKDSEGRVVGVLGTFEDITERKRAEEALRDYERQMDEHKRRFYRETILSVTEGKLDICGPSDIAAYVTNAGLVIEVNDASDIGTARHAVESFCRDSGLSDENVDVLILGVGEAVTNAVKHASGACVYAGANEESVWVAVSDQGKGIDSLILPRAVLLRGFSTKPSLGLGYCLMLDIADRVLLSTGEKGTTVVLIKNLREVEQGFSLANIPDTWNPISI
jgi:PAS domain S-box-containing protein